MKKSIFLATIFTVGSLVAISSDDYPMLNQEAQDQQIQQGRLQDQRLQNQRLETRRQDQRIQDRRLEEQRLQNQRRLVADSSADAPAETALPATPKLKDRFTTTEDHKLANLIRAKIVELTPDQATASNIILMIDNGDVKLVGKVPSAELRTELSQFIQQMKEVRSVHNRLEVTKK